MQRRIICPHCHSPIDPCAMDIASFSGKPYRICPDCDEPIAVVNEEKLSPAQPTALQAGPSATHFSAEPSR